MNDSSLPQRQSLPVRTASPPAGSPAQQAFRLALETVDALRAQLHQLRASQAATRQTYWQQVGPVAAATVAARRALYEPLELALTSGYLTRAEEHQVTDLLVHNAHSLQARFGEDEAAMLARYAPPLPPPEAEEPAAILLPDAPASPEPAPHEQAASTARAHRQQAQASPAQNVAAAQQALLQNTKAAYRQLARLHHPDRAAQADAATQQAQTAIMQRITAAYAAGDLAALLSLLATTDAPGPPGAEAELLLQRYVAALAEQQTQLRQALEAARRPLEDAPWSGTEKQQRTRLREIKRSLRAETDYLDYLGRQLREPASLRQLLREFTAQGQAGL